MILIAYEGANIVQGYWGETGQFAHGWNWQQLLRERLVIPIWRGDKGVGYTQPC